MPAVNMDLAAYFALKMLVLCNEFNKLRNLLGRYGA